MSQMNNRSLIEKIVLLIWHTLMTYLPYQIRQLYDSKSGYWQLALDSKDREKTACLLNIEY